MDYGDLTALEAKLRRQVTNLTDAAIAGIGEKAFSQSLSNIIDTGREIYNAGHAAGWDVHAALVRERLDEAGLTSTQFRNMRSPYLEEF